MKYIDSDLFLDRMEQIYTQFQNFKFWVSL